jgi:hypothetical protein
MKRWPRSLHFLPACNHTVRNFRRGVSLHGHTQHSRESLGFIEHYLDAVPGVAQIARHALARYKRDHGKELDFNRAFWTAPLTAGEAHDLERKQVEDALGLEGIVSLTDHDNIDGAMELLCDEVGEAVVSLEWTLPYGPASFHLGVHNLPRAKARELTAQLLNYTASPDEGRLPGLLGVLDAIPQVLLVLNHPFWEMEPFGSLTQLEILRSFLQTYGRCIHALEVSGLRPWRENELVLELGEDLAMAVVSGGDRHGWEANTMLNLTRARSFSEFVAEIRNDGRSDIAVMPNYHEPFGLRMMQVTWDVLREYPHHPCGRSHWMDRVFFECDDGAVRPLSRCFQKGEPKELRLMTGAMRQLEKQPWHTFVHTAWSVASKRDAVPRSWQTVQPSARPAFTDSERSVA